MRSEGGGEVRLKRECAIRVTLTARQNFLGEAGQIHTQAVVELYTQRILLERAKMPSGQGGMFHRPDHIRATSKLTWSDSGHEPDPQQEAEEEGDRGGRG